MTKPQLQSLIQQITKIREMLELDLALDNGLSAEDLVNH